MRPRGALRHLGMLRGHGTMSRNGIALGAAAFEIDGYCPKPGDVVGSGEITMGSAELDHAFGHREVQLTTEDGRVLAMRFTGNRLGRGAEVAHVDVIGGLPAEREWRR